CLHCVCTTLYSVQCFYCFRFFSRDAAVLLVLHPFPTRRSSDLFDIYLYTDEPMTCHVHAMNVQYAEVGVAEVDVDPANGDEQRLDRKSTRLNSSHVSISYAVFCLKKKTKQSSPNSSPHT